MSAQRPDGAGFLLGAMVFMLALLAFGSCVFVGRAAWTAGGPDCECAR
jgi:hypothetical protein